MEVLSEEFKSIANTINNEIINGIQGMIEGTKTLGDVASSILKRLASQYLEMAIMGKQGSGGLFGSIFQALGFGSNPLSAFSGGGMRSGLDSRALFNTDLGLPSFAKYLVDLGLLMVAVHQLARLHSLASVGLNFCAIESGNNYS